ncbi:MAG: cyclic lactone autoinducer peptide [Halanaerobiales bacterium]|nr:cyclic lactone autoinducer peptide [Halanaerobiales bacterium]
MLKKVVDKIIKVGVNGSRGLNSFSCWYQPKPPKK